MIKICRISLPVFKDTENPEKILNNLTDVPVENNRILTAIMNSKNKWESKPIVWIGDYAYKIHIIKNTPTNIELFQMALECTFKNNHKFSYKIVNKRKVQIIIE